MLLVLADPRTCCSPSNTTSGIKIIIFDIFIIIIKHYFREGLITLSLEYFKINQEDALLYNYNHVEQLEIMITRALDAGKGSSLPAIQRCLPR